MRRPLLLAPTRPRLRDSFSGEVDGTTLQSHRADSGHTWSKHPTATGDILIGSGRLYNSGAAGTCLYTAVAPPSADYDVSADLTFLTDNNSATTGVVGRADATAASLYLARWTTAGDAWQLYKIVTGVATQLGSDSTALPIAAGVVRRLTLRLRGATIQLLVDGVPLIAAVDTTFGAPGLAGVRLTGTSGASAAVHLDNLTVVG